MRDSSLHSESCPTMKRGRRHFSTFNVVILIPAITSLLAFSARWGLAGFIIGVMVLANCAAVFDWLRLPERRFYFGRYTARIASAWFGVFIVYNVVAERVKTLEGGLGWLAVGWLLGWLTAVFFKEYQK